MITRCSTNWATGAQCILWVIKFSTSDNAFRVLWLVHSILVNSSNTLVWPYMVNDCAKGCWAKNVFAGRRYFSLNKTRKENKLFCGKFGSMSTFRSTRKGKKCFFVMSLRLFDQMVLHNIASLSSFFRFRSDFLAFFARILYFKFLEFKEFNKTIIPVALVGYETGDSQLGATRLVSYFSSHIQLSLIHIWRCRRS